MTKLDKIKYSISPIRHLRPEARLLLALMPMFLVFLFREHLPLLFLTPAIYLYPAVFLATFLGGAIAGYISIFGCFLFSLFVLKPGLLVSPLNELPNFIRLNVFVWTSILFVSLVLLLEKALRKAYMALQLRDEFISMASHELKTPITSTKLNIEVLRKMLGEENKNFTHVLDSLERQALRQDKIVSSVLDITLIESNHFSLRKEQGDLKKFVEKGANSARFIMNKGDVELSCISVPGVWDGKRMEQAIYNLVHNAIKYGSLQPVKVTLNTENNNVIIEVRNEGSLIPESEHRKIFEKFGQSSEDTGGLGTGLYIAKHIIELHRGKLDIMPASSGTMMRVTLPFS